MQTWCDTEQKETSFPKKVGFENSDHSGEEREMFLEGGEAKRQKLERLGPAPMQVVC